MDKVQEMLIKMLKRNKFFEKMSDEQLLKFSNLFKLEMATKGQAIIIEWHQPENIYILKKWKLVAKKAHWLNTIVLWEVWEWEVFGEMSFFHKQPAMASVVCESDTCNYWSISRDAFEKFLEENPEVKTQIAETLAKREKENKEKLWWWLDLHPSNTENKIDDIEINL